MNVEIEYVVGVSMGSMPRRDRRKSGVDELISEGMVEVSSVIGSKSKGQVNWARERKEESMPRGLDVVGVRISL